MRYVLDSSVVIDHVRGRPGAHDFLRQVVMAGGELWSVTPVRTEVIAGMRGDEEDRTMRLLDSLRWLEVTTELADHAGRLAMRYVRSHAGIGAVDYLLAAGTTNLGATLLTRNVKHFPMFDGLKPAYA